VRGILDGHIVLDRAIAERGRYPALNVLKSISRTMPGCNEDDQNALINRARRIIATYEDMAELIRLGAYRRGSNPEVDEAIYFFPRIEAILRQEKGDGTDLATCYKLLAEALQPPSPAAPVPEAMPIRRQPAQG
jgi:flagellum-specific ATP synthase